jgi:hypothetical protein
MTTGSKFTVRLAPSDAERLRLASEAANCTPSALLRHLLRIHFGQPDDLAAARLRNGQRRPRRPRRQAAL